MSFRVGLLGALAAVGACTPAEVVTVRRDSGTPPSDAVVDGAIGADAGPTDGGARDSATAPDVVTPPSDVSDAGVVRCTSDRDCADGACDLGRQRGRRLRPRAAALRRVHRDVAVQRRSPLPGVALRGGDGVPARQW